MTRIPTTMAGLALVAVTVVGCGSDDGDETTVSDTGSSSTASTSSSASASTSPSDVPSPTESTVAPSSSDTADPVPSPIINKAVRAAIADDFPALVPSGVPAGWTVSSATYSPKRGGQWRIELTDPTGAPVTLVQSKRSPEQLVSQYLPDAQPAGSVDLSAFGTGTWSAYGGMSAAALAKSFSGTAAVVVGPDQDTVVTLVEELLTAEDGGHGDGG